MRPNSFLSNDNLCFVMEGGVIVSCALHPLLLLPLKQPPSVTPNSLGLAVLSSSGGGDGGEGSSAMVRELLEVGLPELRPQPLFR